MKGFFLSTLLLCTSGVWAQEEEEKPRPNLVLRNLFNSIGLTALAELNTSPIIFYKEQDLFSDSAYHNTPIRVSGVTAFSLTWCPRVNVLNIRDKASFSLDMPMSIAMSLWGWDQKNIVTKNDGKGHYTLPVFLMFNYGAGSTWNNMSDKGFAAGFGIQYTHAPFAYGEQIHNGIVPDYPDPPSAWTTPVVALDYRFSASVLTMDLNFRFWPGRIVEYQMGSHDKRYNTLRENLIYKFTCLIFIRY